MKRLLLLLLLLPVSLNGAAFVNSAAGGGTSGSGDRTLSITPTSGALAVVCFQLAQNTNSSTTVTDDNSDGLGTYYKVFTTLNRTSQDMGGCYVREALFSNGTACTVTVNSGSNTSGEIVMMNISGMTRTGSSAVLQSKTQANGTSSAGSPVPAPVFDSAALTGNLTIAFLGSSEVASGSADPPSGWTERRDTGQSTPVSCVQVSTRDSGFTGTTVTWAAINANSWNSGIVEFDTSAAAAGFPTSIRKRRR